MIKNLIIIALVVLCSVLTAMLLDKKPQNKVVKLDRNGIIHIADIEGISLSTDINKVDGLLRAAKFKCKKNENIKTAESSALQAIKWYCSYDSKSRKTTLNISAKDGKVTSISRNGIANFKNAEETMDYIESLKLRLNTREAVSFNQTANRTTFYIRNKKGLKNEVLSYDVVLRKTKNGNGDIEESAVYKGLAQSKQ